MISLRKSALLLTLCAAAIGSSHARNPYLPLGECIPDGEPYVFEDPDNPGSYRVYIYGSHDQTGKMYCGLDQVVWSAPVDSLDNWRYDGVIFESKLDANGKKLFADGHGDVLYAPDVAVKSNSDGSKTYYLYPNVQGERNNLVAKSSRPDGPFTVCNWDPKDPKKTIGPFAFDPAAFVDDDGRAYGYWGFNQGYACELDTATMATVKPGTQIVKTLPGKDTVNQFRFYEASSMRKIKDKYVLVYSRWTNDGEDGLPGSNYTLAYAWSNNPLGPWTYGGTIIDGRGIEKIHGKNVPTAVPNGNTHGSICEINGKWWVFYHRQADTNEYSRQAMVAPIDVEVFEGPDGFVRISQGEFTCEGFETEGLNPFKWTPAGIACYFTGPTPAYQEYPNVVYSGSHSKVIRAAYDGKSDPYAPERDRCTLVNNTAGSKVGYKYFNFSDTYGNPGTKLEVKYVPEGVAGTMDIYLDAPCKCRGAVKIGTLQIPAETGGMRTATVDVPNLQYYNGKHALYFVFNSEAQGKSLCELESFRFVK
jgi:arabinoxylan arabinofuranohydrolase